MIWIFKPDTLCVDNSKMSEIEYLIRSVEAADSADALTNATKNLVNATSIHAIPTLIRILGFNNPGAALQAVDGLVALGENAVLPLLTKIDSYNYGARGWSIRALALIGDVRGLEILEQALREDIGPSVRRAAAKGLGNLKLIGLPRDQQDLIRIRSLTALEAGCHDAEWAVRYAVIVGLESSILHNPAKLEFTLRAQRALQYLSLANISVIRERAKLAIQNISNSLA
uniref:Phycocyanin alpha phycocyanobilin lyase n=1 Tax=Paulinella micropora TaxID=1928728 RepID=A0A385I0U5_9EUKA|nr:phycocyanin alpha phycocyanobilin lyase [Paulinella micropora]AXY63546.1 phycocyanin alpha phycocyanobilin lyase [Paulinella micropora]